MEMHGVASLATRRLQIIAALVMLDVDPPNVASGDRSVTEVEYQEEHQVSFCHDK